ncbi:MAG: PKD domain-containing protein [Methanolinea sp.]|nr:PKD domain-containing protein [Methanolinea sp.]
MPGDERVNAGISELIGAILLVGLVITAMAIVAVVLLSNPPPEEIPHLSALASNTSNTILLYHNGGDALKEEQTIISVNNVPEVPHSKITIRNEDGTSESATWDITKTPWTVGKALVVTYEGPGMPEYVQLIYRGGSAEALLLTEYFVPVNIPPPGPICSDVSASFKEDVTSGYAPLTVSFTDTSTYQDPITSWLWNFGDGSTSTSQNPTHTYTNPGTYTVTLTVTNRCGKSDSWSSYITVMTSPSCGFISGTKYNDLNGNGNRDPGEPGLAGWTIQIFRKSGNDWTYVTSGITAADGTYTVTGLQYQPAEQYLVKEILQPGWIRTQPATEDYYNFIVLNPPHCYETGVNFGNRQVLPPTADFTAAPTSGYAPLTVQFTDTSTGNPAQWQWDVNNDGVVDYTVQNPTHTYSSPGTYSVRLTVSNPGGSDTRIKTGYITVNAPPTTNIYLVANKDGSLQQGGYMQFRVTGPYSYIRHGNTYYNLNIGDNVRLEITSDGTGNIYATSSTVNNFRFNNVRLTLNGVDKGTKDIGSGDIWISGYDSYLSTLTLIVPARREWTQLNVNGVSIIYGIDSREIRIFNLRPDTWGVMNLDTRNDVFYSGAATGYQLT